MEKVVMGIFAGLVLTTIGLAAGVAYEIGRRDAIHQLYKKGYVVCELTPDEEDTKTDKK